MALEARDLYIPVAMDAQKFLSKTNKAVVEFLKKEFQNTDNAGLPRIQFEMGLPRTQTELVERVENRKGGFFSMLADKSFFAYVCPYSVSRAQAQRTEEKLQYALPEQDDVLKKSIVQKRGTENYRIKYLVMGPCLSTDEGQKVLSALITLFYDARILEIENESGELDRVQLEEPLQSGDEDLEKFLATTQIQRRPIYLFSAVANISSGKIIETNKVVHSRAISFRPNV